MTDLEKKLSNLNGVKDKVYKDLVNQYVRERYSISDELSIIRQQTTKVEEFNQYNAFVEECKAKAKQEVFNI